MSTINTNTTSTKTTQRDFYNALIALVSNGELPQGITADMTVDFLNGRIAQLDKKSASAGGADRKPTARQIENDGLKTAILSNMEQNTLYTIGDMLKQFDCFAEDMSSQRLNAIVSQMYADAKRSDGLTKMGTTPTIERVEEKRKAYFRKIVG